MQNEAERRKRFIKSLPAFENDLFLLLFFEPSDQSFNNHLFSIHEKGAGKRGGEKQKGGKHLRNRNNNKRATRIHNKHEEKQNFTI
jgi:hypothetical protein